MKRTYTSLVSSLLAIIYKWHVAPSLSGQRRHAFFPLCFSSFNALRELSTAHNESVNVNGQPLRKWHVHMCASAESASAYEYAMPLSFSPFHAATLRSRERLFRVARSYTPSFSSTFSCSSSSSSPSSSSSIARIHYTRELFAFHTPVKWLVQFKTIESSSTDSQYSSKFCIFFHLFTKCIYL